MSESEKRAAIRIEKRFFDEIVKGKKEKEYRKDTPFWRKRLEPYVGMENPPLQAVFICGKQVHRRKIVEVKHIRTPEGISKRYVPTPFCYEIHLGEKVS